MTQGMIVFAVLAVTLIYIIVNVIRKFKTGGSSNPCKGCDGGRGCACNR